MPSRPSDSAASPIAGPSHDSAHSSPRPESEFELEQSQGPASLGQARQRDQDVQLAASMTQGTRARSATLLDRAEMSTPGRGGGRGGVMGTSPPRADNVGGGRRRGSVGASNALDHLADDLEIHAHQQDIGYFDRGTTSPDKRQGLSERQQQRFVPHSMQQSPSIQHSAAAARFYRQRRNLSDSSIDSQGGAYIDHRRQPHSLASGTPGRGVMASGGSRSRGVDGYEGRSSGMGMGRTGLRREVSAGDEYEEGQASRSNRQTRSGSPPSPSHEPSQSGISTRTARQFTTEDLDEDAIIDDEESRQSPRRHLERHASQKSYMSVNSRHSPEHGDFFPELSRQGSTLGKPEEDVCFPVHSSSADPDLIDLGLSSMYLDGHEQHHERHPMHEAHGGMGIPGVLHNFPFPFDFGALEEFADLEKDGMPIPGSRRKTDHGLSTSPPGYGSVGASGASRPRMGMSLGTDGLEGRRTMRQRKLSESVAPGRFQRKLALFEGAGDEATSAGRPEGTRGVFQSIMDVKTPLLADKGTALNGMGGGGYGSGGAGGPPTPATGSARPYRFSFYSNSLPSTIHARSLAEIPAEGQTFEELFVGHRTEYEESIPGVDPRMAFSPPSQAGTGANTPNGASTSTRTSVNGARPAGVAQSGVGASAKKVERSKGGMMRTEIDAESNTWWLDVLCPTDAEMKVLSKVFGIHPLTTEDIQMEETREKIELFRNYYFVCFRSFEQDPYSPTYLEPLNMYIIVFREGTLSFHFRGTPHPQNVRRRIKQLKDYINVTSDWISYALIDDITDAFGPLIQNIEYEVDSIDELVLILKEAEQSDMLRRIGTCRKKVMGLLRLMGNKADVVKGLSKRCNENWSVAPKSDIGLYLSDIQDHITTSTQNLTHYEKILSRSHSNYLAQISIEMTDANNQINDVLSKLTALGTVLIPMNLITGLWGMNVHVPGQDVENLHWFFSIIGCLGGIALGGAWLTYKVFVKP